MTFREDADISGRRRATTGGRGGRIAAGGGLGSLLLVGLFLLMGGNPGDIGQVLGGGGGQAQLPGGQTSELEHCQTPEDGNIHADCRVDYAAGSVDQMWETMLPEQAGIDYVAPGRVVFQDTVQSGCGAATSSTGPFYCPADQSAYFDVSFFDQLDRLGGDTDEASALIELTMVEPDDGWGLGLLRSAAGEWRLPTVDAPAGSRLRVRVRARDVMLATQKPEGISALNVVPARIAAIADGDGPQVLVRLDHGGEELIARVTRRSVETLGLAPGREVFAVVKAVTFDPEATAAAPARR